MFRVASSDLLLLRIDGFWSGSRIRPPFVGSHGGQFAGIVPVLARGRDIAGNRTESGLLSGNRGAYEPFQPRVSLRPHVQELRVGSFHVAAGQFLRRRAILLALSVPGQQGRGRQCRRPMPS